MRTLSLADVKTNLSALVNAVEGTHERIVITRRGRTSAVLVSAAELEELEETVAILSDHELVRQIADGEAELRAGRGLDEETVRAMLAARRG